MSGVEPPRAAAIVEALSGMRCPAAAPDALLACPTALFLVPHVGLLGLAHIDIFPDQMIALPRTWYT